MKYKYSKIFGKDVVIIQPDVFYDFRGEYIETWNVETYKGFNSKEYNKQLEWKQDDISTSIKYTLRGFHRDSNTWKLIQCVYGALYQVVVDNRPKSKNYLKWEAYALNDKNRTQILIPPGFGNAFLVLSDIAVFSYKQSTLYQGKEKQFTIKWDYPKVGAYWPIDNPILSERDIKAKYLK